MWGHHTEYWDHHAWVNIQYSAPQKLNIQYSGPKILNVQYSVAVRSGNIQHSPSSETQYSIFSGLKNSIFNILGDQKLNIQYSPISKLNIQYSNIGCGDLILDNVWFTASKQRSCCYVATWPKSWTRCRICNENQSVSFTSPILFFNENTKVDATDREYNRH